MKRFPKIFPEVLIFFSVTQTTSVELQHIVGRNLFHTSPNLGKLPQSPYTKLT